MREKWVILTGPGKNHKAQTHLAFLPNTIPVGYHNAQLSEESETKSKHPGQQSGKDLDWRSPTHIYLH